MADFLPMRPSDWKADKVRFPVIGMPKIDGVRGVHFAPNGFTARTLKKFKNVFTNQVFGHPAFEGLDGELAAGKETDQNLCRMTTSATSSYDMEPFVLWWLFDFITDKTAHLAYVDRLIHLANHVKQVTKAGVPYSGRLRLVPCKLLNNLEELEAYDAENLDAGYEGTIICDPNGVHKSGTSTAKEGGKLRIKRFLDAEAKIIDIEEAETNDNEAVVNALGRTERSSHQANKSGNGMIGTLTGVDVKTGEKVRVGPGKMTHTDRVFYFLNQGEILGKIMKYKYFPKGIKDKPRFPTFENLRSEEDL